MIVLTLGGIVLMWSGQFVAGLGAVSVGTLINSVLLFRRQIHTADERMRAERPRQ